MSKDQLALIKKDTVDVVAERVRAFQEKGELCLPENYSPENAMKSAWLLLQETETRDKKPVLAACTKNSIANSLLDMVVQGLNPAKNQCYFIPYGDKLSCQRSYFGTMAVAKMVNPSIKEIVAEVVYEGDTLKYKIDRGKKVIAEHMQELENVDSSKIKAAYCMVIDHEGQVVSTEIMTMEQIKQAWRQSKMSPLDEKGNVKSSSTHGKFTAEMAKRTVINKTCKPIVNASSDSHLFRKSFNRADEVRAEEDIAQEIEDNANSETIDIEATEVYEDDPEITEDTPETAKDESPRDDQAENTETEEEGPGF